MATATAAAAALARLDGIGFPTRRDEAWRYAPHRLLGELDEEFPEDQQVYPYYVVRHGPEAGVYAFSEGDTVPDGAYVVLKARASRSGTSPVLLTGMRCATRTAGRLTVRSR